MPNSSRAQHTAQPAASTADPVAFCFPRCFAGRELKPCPTAVRVSCRGKGSSCSFSSLTFNRELPHCCASQAHVWSQTITVLQMKDTVRTGRLLKAGRDQAYSTSPPAPSSETQRSQEKAIAIPVSGLILAQQFFLPGARGAQHKALVYSYHWQCLLYKLL